METLLQPGDKITIRSDIEEHRLYSMFLDDDNGNKKYNVWIPEMAAANEEVTIKGYVNGQYTIENCKVFTYTDEMFDPALMNYLYEEYLLNN